MQVHNEENIVEQALRCLYPYVDTLIVLDDASTDETSRILKELQRELPNLTLIFNEVPSELPGQSVANYETLLRAARKLRGTHFIVMNVDEIISSNCLSNNLLRNEILNLKPGEQLKLPLIHVWGSTHEYRVNRSANETRNNFCSIFCDMKKASYKKVTDVDWRLPSPLKNKVYTAPSACVVLQYSYADFDNALIKKALYQCLELARGHKSVDLINQSYRTHMKEEVALLDMHDEQWKTDYPYFDPDVYSLPNYACELEVYDLFNKYGKEFFKDLDIWDIDWEFDS
ncbi:MAG: glycosyltransferase [Candidatus Babeliales bacterium]